MRMLPALASFLLVPLGLAACQGPRSPLQGVRLVDLTHAYDEDTIYWPTAEGFALRIDARGETPGGWYYEANTFTTAEHGGTHLDAPVHFAEGRRSVDEIPLEQLTGPGVVVDVRPAVARDRDHQVSVADLEAWEAVHGRIPSGAIVLLNTGSSHLWPDRERYMGTAERGAGAVAKLHFPGLHPDAARWLVTQRSIGAVGLDTPSIDHGPSKDFRTHRILFEANVPALENVARLDELPPTGLDVIALPMKIRRGSGAPARIVALVH
jgi:kynurenine formamidase